MGRLRSFSPYLGRKAPAVAQQGPFLIILSTCLALAYWWRIPHKRGLFAFLGALLITALLVEVFGRWALYMVLNNNAQYNATILLQFLLVARIAADRRRPAWPFLAVGATGALAMAASYHIRGHADVLWLEGITVIALLVVGMCLHGLWRTAEQAEGVVWTDPAFWLFLGLLVYHTGMLPLVGLLDVLSRDHPVLLNNLYVLVQLLATVQYLFVARACVLEATRQHAANG